MSAVPDVTWRRRLPTVTVAQCVVCMALAAALLLALPGQTVTTKSPEEVFALFDGLHRVLSGHMPGRDFLTAQGPLAFYLPALGYLMTGSPGAAFPLAMALLLVALAPVMAHILASRLQPVLALLTAALLTLVVAVPMALGDGLTQLSFAQFHNRIGWAAISLLLLMHLPAPAPQPLRDMACATALVLLMALLRPTYGIVALLFLVFLATDPAQRRGMLPALGLVAALLAAFALLWPGMPGMLRALEMAAGAGGILRGSWGQILDHLLANFTDYVLALLLAGFALHRRPRLRDALFYAFCAVAGFWLINHNLQRWGILPLYAMAVVAAERLLRQPRPAVWATPSGIKLFVTAMMLPTLVHCSAALLLHAAVATSNSGRAFPLAGMERVRLASLWTEGSFAAGGALLDQTAEATSVLAALSAPPGRLLVLGGPDPFSAALDLPPARGIQPDLRWLETMGPDHHLTPAEMLADVDIVAERVAGIGPAEQLYLPSVTGSFDLVAETAQWRFYRRPAP